MTVKKLGQGEWLCDFYVNGRGSRRVRKSFATRSEAVAYENYYKNEAANKPWLAEKEDRRTLSELIELWHRLHGQQLSSSKFRLGKLELICRGLNNPVASQITPKDWAHYRDRRMRGEIENGYHTNPQSWIAKPITVNTEHLFLNAVFNELKRLGEWTLPNPLDGTRAFKQTEKEMSWLSEGQIKQLLEALQLHGNPHLTLIVKICLATGARWMEVQSLTQSQLLPHKITFINTKGKKNRTVPIPQWLYDDLVQFKGKFFTPCYREFSKVLARTDIELVEGQTTHVLRHTFASHFMMNGGNILVLQRILGHANIRETMRYAHFAPDHLEEAAQLNPLTKFMSTK